MHESDVIADVRKRLPPGVYALKLNLAYTGGVPDSWYSGTRSDLWVEWKLFRGLPPVIDLTNVKAEVCLSALQQQWLRSRAAEGRNVAVIAAYQRGGVVFPGLQWQRPLSREAFLEAVIPRNALADWIARQTC